MYNFWLTARKRTAMMSKAQKRLKDMMLFMLDQM